MTEINENEYLTDAEGRLVPIKMIKDIDRQRDNLVKEYIAKAKALSASIQRFKTESFNDVAAHISLAAEKYNLKIGGEKGNVTLMSYDGQYKIIRSVAEKLDFNESLAAAKIMIDNCISKWSAGVNQHLKALVTRTFKTDREGKISTVKVLDLMTVKINDDEWQMAMQALSDSMSVSSTKSYIRFYERQVDGSYKAIPLDIAADFQISPANSK
ncbi:MAG: DUF3164 family protein [Proteobacteria bacterium]|nr:DUF3164 family protein [Pseudomonadota bacterium]